MRPALEEELQRRNVKRVEKVEPEPAVAGGPKDAFDEFRRLLRLSGLSDEDMTDDQRDDNRAPHRNH